MRLSGWRGQRSLPGPSGVSCLQRGHSTQKTVALGNAEEDEHAGNNPEALQELMHLNLKG